MHLEHGIGIYRGLQTITVEGGTLDVAAVEYHGGDLLHVPLYRIDQLERYRGVDAAKKVVRKAVFFAVNHLAEQMRALGWATTSVGTAAAERIEQLESRVHELEARLARLDPDGTDDSTRS